MTKNVEKMELVDKTWVAMDQSIVNRHQLDERNPNICTFSFFDVIFYHCDLFSAYALKAIHTLNRTLYMRKRLL